METVRRRYDAAGVSADLHPFITDMPTQLGQSHLVISRAGASSVAELAASGRPAVLVPFPGAMDDHQTANARTVADSGGGWCVPEQEMSAGHWPGALPRWSKAPTNSAVPPRHPPPRPRPGGDNSG